MPNKLDTLLDPQVAQEFLNDGYSIENLADEFWVSRKIASDYVKAHGLKPPSMRLMQDVIDLDHVVKMLEGGAHFDDVAEHYGYSNVAIKKYCGEQGIFQVFRFLKNGGKIRVRESARSEKLAFGPEMLERMVKMLERGMSWDDISNEVGYSRCYCNNYASKHGVRSMYTRVNGKLFQIRSNPRDPNKFERRIAIDDEKFLADRVEVNA